MTGLYVHVPFCLKKCHYCNFVITLSKGRGEFLDSLAAEAAHAAGSFEGRDFQTLYVGGGTPSALSVPETRELFSILHKNFSLKKTEEQTWEANPLDVTEEKAACWRELGINRVSLGAQSFRDKTLEAINRDHTSNTIHRAAEILRKEGFGNLSVDLILSLPNETVEDVTFSLNEAMKLRPQHVSLYELTIEKKTVFGSWHEQGRLSRPCEEEQIKMLALARDFLKEEGFIHYELLSHAKPGFESWHNRIYWANREYLGLGPGAFSYWGGRRFRHSGSYEEYVGKIQKKDWSAREEETLDAQAKEIESFLLALRLAEGAAADRFKSLLKKMEKNLEALQEKGLLLRDRRSIRLTPKGQLFAETVFSELSSID